MAIFCSKCKYNGTNLLKEFNNENYPQVKDLPNEIMARIFSYLDKKEKMKVSVVNKRWFQNANYEIDNLLIKWPEQHNQDFQNLINRFPKLKNLELATKITNKNDLPLVSFEFDGTLEFDIGRNLIPTKNSDNTSITRIRINPAKVKEFEYKKSHIINFEIDMPYPQDFDFVLEEILSLENVSKITYSALMYGDNMDPQESINFFKIIESIFSRPHLKQIDFAVLYDLDLSIETVFPKNFNVEEITFEMNSLKVWNKIFDALPNIKKIKVSTHDNLQNLPVILRKISVLKQLKSLHVAICSRDEEKDEKFEAQKFRDCLEIRDCCDIIKDNFPIKAEVVIADMDIYNPDDLTNLIKKEEGKEPKIVCV